MKIISKYKDYYDSMGLYGIDPLITYVRKTDEFSMPSTKVNNKLNKVSEYIRFINTMLNSNIRRDANMLFSLNVIGFAGDYYYILKLTEWDKKYNYTYTYFTDINLIDNFFDNFDKFNIDNFEIKYYIEFSKKYYKERYKEYKRELDTSLELSFFTDLNVPIFIIEENKIILNPSNLKEYNFHKLVKPIDAFQELSMFISGFLNNKENNLIEIDDKYKKQQHGMDKWSFRNPDPPKRKKRNKK